MPVRFFFINLHSSRVFSSKYQGFVSFLNENFPLINIVVKDNFYEKEIFNNFDGYVNFLVLEPRLYLQASILENILGRFEKFILICNHFFVTSNVMLDVVKTHDRRILFVLENEASLKTVSEYYDVNINYNNSVVMPPVFDLLADERKFEHTARGKESKAPTTTVINVGSIYINRRGVHWWQRKFGANSYYPDRYKIRKKSKCFGIKDCSGVIYRDDKIYRFINILCRAINFDYWKKNNRDYFSIDLSREYIGASFVMAIPDIFGVIPQIVFQAMKSGLILVGTDGRPFSSLGFVHGNNYVSVGGEMTMNSLALTLDRIRTMDLVDIEKIRANSLAHVKALEVEARSVFLKIVRPIGAKA